jgi:chemotaxis protein methyltransferase CheR
MRPASLSENPVMTEAERKRIAEYIEVHFGIRMPEEKKTLLQGRLLKRLLALGIPTYAAYFDYIYQPNPAGQEEFLHFVDLISTHETTFFREATHFPILEAELTRLIDLPNPEPRLRILCAACSTGQEAYTIAMVVSEVLAAANQNRDFVVEAIDLSDRAVAIAQRGVYTRSQIATIPPQLVTKYFMRSKDPKQDLVRVVPELRSRLQAHTGNLIAEIDYHLDEYDIIFCRNVLIYFELANQKKVLHRLSNRLVSGGTLFLGHTETMSTWHSSLVTIAPAVYRKP